MTAPRAGASAILLHWPYNRQTGHSHGIAAEILGVTRQALNNIVNEKAAISANMAIRLEKAFGGTANAWLQMQNNYDLARARRHEDQLKVQRNAPELVRSA